MTDYPGREAADPPDRISVRDLVREVEIGAFKSERGVMQRVRFNVALEVAGTDAAASDDVDRVLSYDTIVEAIDAVLATGRLNLLETCAEGIAERCLADSRALRAMVRVEKLDRVPGALGVEIVRRRGGAAGPPAAGMAAAAIVALPSSVLPAGEAERWRRALAGAAGGVIALVSPGPLLDQARESASGLGLDAVAARRMALLAYDQAAWAFAGAGGEPPVVETRTELQHAVRTGRPAIWAPFKLLNETEKRGAALEVALAELAKATGAALVIRVGEAAPQAPEGAQAIDVKTPEEFLAATGVSRKA